MRKIIIAFVLIPIVAAAPTDDHNAQIVKYDMSYDANGGYSFSYETTNGITRSETGHIVNDGLNSQELVVEGSFSYIDDNGMPVVVHYTADRNGYQTKTPTVMPVLPGVQYSLPPGVVATLLGK